MACREVSTWITENVLTPVERFITEAREACEQINTWVEERIQQPVESWASRTEQRCREQDCNWWCACCNKWFCWLVTVVVRVVTWVVVTVGKWVASIVCKVVVTVIGIVVEFVLKVIHRLVAFFVCLFTDPLRAVSTLWDLVNDVIDAVDDVVDLVVSLIEDVKEILNDVSDFVGTIGRTFCIFGDVACAIFSAIFGVIKGVIDWVADVVDWVGATIDGVRDLILGILTLNWCRIQRGLGIFSVARAITSILRLPGMIFWVGPSELIRRRGLETNMDNALQRGFDGDPEGLARARELARIGGSPLGVPCTIDPRRLAIRSTEFLRSLHVSGTLDLYALAGRFTDCQGKATWNQFDGELVYTGTQTTVSKTDIDAFVSDGPAAVPSFTAYPIAREPYRRVLELARRKAFQVGINLTWARISDLEITDSRFIPLDADEGDGSIQRELIGTAGRPAFGEDLSVVPVIAVFGYVNGSLHGLATQFGGGRAGGPSGVTFRYRWPEVGFRYVMIHEVGHYFDLVHEGHTNAGQIMWKPILGNDWWATIGNYGFGSGEADFITADAERTWDWIATTPEARDTILR